MWPFRRRKPRCAEEVRVALAVALIDDIQRDQLRLEADDRNWELQDRLLDVRTVLTGRVSRRARRQP